MNPNHHIWREWANKLHRWGVHDLAATCLEAAGPLTILGAQAVYMGRPFLYSLWPEERWQTLTNLLEDNQQARDFVALLRDQETPA